MAEANDLPPQPSTGAERPGFLVVAEDILGGRFEMDGGGLGVGPGTICYCGPDSLEWADLGIAHGQFVERTLAGATPEFYDDMRSEGWEQEVEAIGMGQGLSLWPPPFSVEGQDVGAVTRRVVPHAELVASYHEMARQL